MGVATALAVGSLAVGAYGAMQQGKAAKRAGDSQAYAAELQAQAARDQLDFGKEQYADWKGMFYPALGDLRAMAYEEDRPNFAAISADVDTAFDTSQDINRRNMERFGVKPTDGAFSASETQYGLGRAMATVNANNQARQQAKDTKFNRLSAFAGLSSGMQSNATNTVNQGYGALGGAYGNQANMYGNRAQQYSEAAASGAQMFGRGLAGIANWWQNNSFGGV